MSECWNKPLCFSLMPLAKTGNKEVMVKVVVVAPSLTLTCRHINSPPCYCLFSLFGQFYKVASGDRWAVPSERAIFLRHFHPLYSWSSILCGRSPCLKPPQEAGWAPGEWWLLARCEAPTACLSLPSVWMLFILLPGKILLIITWQPPEDA